MCNKPFDLNALKIIPFHTHTDRSDGNNSIHRNVEVAKEVGLAGLGVMDHGTGSGLVAHTVACNEHGIIPTLGIEFYFRLPDVFNDSTRNSGSGRFHITMMALGKRGYDQLIGINNDSHQNIEESRKVKYPITTFDMFREHNKGDLIVMTGCVASVTFHDEIEVAEYYINELIKIFGNNNVYAEVQPHVITRSRKGSTDVINSFDRPLQLANKFNLKTVWTNDAHAATEKDLPLLKRFTLATKGYSFTADYIKSPQVMFDEAVKVIGQDNAEKAFIGIDEIANRVVDAGVVDFHRPFRLPEVKEEVAKLHKYLATALEDDIKTSGQDEQVLRERYAQEYALLTKYNFFPYFAVLTDIMNQAIAKNVRIISRGSASGSYLWYLMKGSQLHPIEHGLMFERFLAELRLSSGELPDIDADIASSLRYIVQDYSARKYNFVGVGTLQTYNHKSLVRLIARIHFKETGIHLPKLLVDGAAEADPDDLENNSDFVEMFDGIIWARDMYAAKIGTRSGYGRHACAVVPLDPDMPVPIEHWATEPVVAYNESGSLKELQLLGLVKYDFLASDTMDVLQLLYEMTGVECPKVIKDNDPCFEVFNQLDTAGIFQFDTPVSRNLLKLMNDNWRKIKSIRDLSDLTSLGRPGPLQQGYHVIYAEQSADISNHPEFIRKIYEKTGGVIIYQEQVSELFARVAFDEYNTEAKEYGVLALKALVPKNQKVAKTEAFLEKYHKLHDMFIEGGVKYHSLEVEYLEELFTSLDGFIRYGFNLSHALSYANVSAQQAWYKHYFPQQFWSILLNKLANTATDRDKLLRYIVDASINHDLQFVPPNVNKASADYVLDGDKILCPIDMVVGLGKTVMENIITEREKNGVFTSLADFNNRVRVNSSIKKLLYDAKMLDNLPGTLLDLGVLEHKYYSVPTKWTDCPNEKWVTSVSEYLIVFSDGTSLELTNMPSDDLLSVAKELKIKHTENANDIKLNTLIKYYAHDGVLINYKRVEYIEQEPEPVPSLNAVKQALGFALPTNLKELFAVVDSAKDQVVGFITEIYRKKSAKGTEMLKVDLHNGQRIWFVLSEANGNDFLRKKTKMDTEFALSLKEGDLIRAQLVMSVDKETHEQMSFGQVRYAKVLA